MERDEKGRFVKGNTAGISTEVARDYQRRSVEKRKENKSVAEMLKAALAEDIGNGMTKGEFLIRKAINNHKDGKLSFRDLRDMAAILGEDVLRIQAEGIEEVGIRIVDTRKRDGSPIIVDYGG